ncbi:hypothetical protein EJ08DRAFT_660891 [Tothia fuscella]|uniref:Uncharacterized protein n=1 Tax=Tothia fuscella TaxID=1048955 RepID=A0A9P4NRM0_9PEZI|nr:hypothetical protein EJ08DRAFT_660891 [Tothia fuscella]
MSSTQSSQHDEWEYQSQALTPVATPTGKTKKVLNRPATRSIVRWTPELLALVFAELRTIAIRQGIDLKPALEEAAKAVSATTTADAVCQQLVKFRAKFQAQQDAEASFPAANLTAANSPPATPPRIQAHTRKASASPQRKAQKIKVVLGDDDDDEPFTPTTTAGISFKRPLIEVLESTSTPSDDERPSKKAKSTPPPPPIAIMEAKIVKKISGLKSPMPQGTFLDDPFVAGGLGITMGSLSPSTWDFGSLEFQDFENLIYF